MTDNLEITWPGLVRAEPRLGALLAEAQAVEDDGSTPSFCANEVWARQFKPRLAKLVGWYAEGEDRMLHTNRAYDLAYARVCNALPACRDCGCTDGEWYAQVCERAKLMRRVRGRGR
jgi:hypothetical protein